MKRIVGVVPTLTLFAAACSGGPKLGPVRTTTVPADASATATEPAACPVATIACDKALDLARAVAMSDWDAVLRDLRATPAACPGPTAGGLGGPYPLCDGASPGELRHGFPVAHHGSEGVMLNGADFRAEIIRDVD